METSNSLKRRRPGVGKDEPDPQEKSKKIMPAKTLKTPHKRTSHLFFPPINSPVVSISSMVMTKDQKYLITSSYDAISWVWDLETLTTVASLKSPSEADFAYGEAYIYIPAIYGSAITDDSKLFVTGDGMGKINLWQFETRTLLFTTSWDVRGYKRSSFEIFQAILRLSY